MPAYEEIRTALNRGFSVDNLRVVTALSLTILREASPEHPAVFVTLATVCRWIADAWDGIPLQSSVADRVESQLKPRLEALLNVADGDATTVCAALDVVATAFREAIAHGLDSNLT